MGSLWLSGNIVWTLLRLKCYTSLQILIGWCFERSLNNTFEVPIPKKRRGGVFEGFSAYRFGGKFVR